MPCLSNDNFAVLRREVSDPQSPTVSRTFNARYVAEYYETAAMKENNRTATLHQDPIVFIQCSGSSKSAAANPHGLLHEVTTRAAGPRVKLTQYRRMSCNRYGRPVRLFATSPSMSGQIVSPPGLHHALPTPAQGRDN